MEIPNPYTGDYKKLIVIPIVLAIISILLITVISPIRLGIDFKGGINVEIPVSQEINLDEFRSSLEQKGYVITNLKQNVRPSDFIIQAELARPEFIVRADELKQSYFELRSNVSELEAQVAYSSDTSIQTQYVSERAKLDVVANSLFSLAGYDQNASSYSSTHLLTRQVQEAHVHLREVENEKLLSTLEAAVPNALTEPNIKERTATLASDFLERAFMVVVYSVILTSIVVFLIFRSVVPSIAVLTGAGLDIIFALGAMSIFGIPLTLASFSALLMLVGFSLDTDILLTMRLVKRKEGSVAQRAYDSMKTGMTMSFATGFAFVALFGLALLTHESLYYEISAVVIAGLFGDLIATWAFNAVIMVAHLQGLAKSGKIISRRPLLSYLFKN